MPPGDCGRSYPHRFHEWAGEGGWEWCDGEPYTDDELEELDAQEAQDLMYEAGAYD